MILDIPAVPLSSLIINVFVNPLGRTITPLVPVANKQPTIKSVDLPVYGVVVTCVRCKIKPEGIVTLPASPATTNEPALVFMSPFEPDQKNCEILKILAALIFYALSVGVSPLNGEVIIFVILLEIDEPAAPAVGLRN